MTERIRNVSIDEAPVGAMLAENCLADDGTLLLPKSRSLTAPIIQRLRKLGVKTISLLDDNASADNTQNAGRELQTVDSLFSRFSSDPYYCAIKEALVEHIIASGQSAGDAA